MSFRLKSRKTSADGSRRRSLKQVLWIIVLASVGLHLLVGIVLGSMVIYRHLFKQEVMFSATSEPVRTLDPRQVVHEVKIQKRLAESGRPPVVNRLQTRRDDASFELPEIEVDATQLDAALKSVPMQNFALAGTSTGLGRGSGSGGGAGIGSTVNFFGAKATAERIAIIVDSSVSMVEDHRGGVEGYRAVKDELALIFESISDATYLTFNTFSERVQELSPTPLLVDNSVRQRANDFIAALLTLPDRANSKTLVRYTNQGEAFTGDSDLIPPRRGLTRLDLALVAAMRQRPQVIFVLSDGAPRVVKDLTPEEQEALDKRVDEWTKAQERRTRQDEENLKRRQEEYARAQQEAASRRARKGLPPQFQEYGGGPGIARPSPPFMSEAAILEDIKRAADLIYTKNNLPKPRIIAVGYACKPSEERFLRDLATAFGGAYRNVSSLVKPIKEP